MIYNDLSSWVSFPLYRPWRLGRNIVNYAIDAADFIDDAVGNGAEESHVEAIEIGRHAVSRSHGPKRTDKFIRTVIAHHPHRAHR